jgi:hypothetical protein
LTLEDLEVETEMNAECAKDLLQHVFPIDAIVLGAPRTCVLTWWTQQVFLWIVGLEPQQFRQQQQPVFRGRKAVDTGVACPVGHRQAKCGALATRVMAAVSQTRDARAMVRARFTYLSPLYSD